MKAWFVDVEINQISFHFVHFMVRCLFYFNLFFCLIKINKTTYHSSLSLLFHSLGLVFPARVILFNSYTHSFLRLPELKRSTQARETKERKREERWVLVPRVVNYLYSCGFFLLLSLFGSVTMGANKWEGSVNRAQTNKSKTKEHTTRTLGT